MPSLWEKVKDFMLRYVVEPFRHFGPFDLIDILLLSALIYALYRFAKARRAGRVVAGLIVVVIASLLVSALHLPALTYIVHLFSSAFFFCFVLIFQPEIRDALERIGNSRLVAPRSDTIPQKLYPLAKEVTAETLDAVFEMSETCTGALIVFEGLTKLGEYAETGKYVDARVTSHLLSNIFFDKAPLHDGAVIIRNFRIYAASVVLPSTKSTMDFGSMGTRHRAAVGVSEVSDALVVVVSEQSGKVSVAQEGRLLRGVDRDMLEDILMTYLAGNLYLRTRRAESKRLFLERLEKLTNTPVSDRDEPKIEAEQLEMPLPKPGIPELYEEEDIPTKGG